jgi:hypothetical protein
MSHMQKQIVCGRLTSLRLVSGPPCLATASAGRRAFATLPRIDRRLPQMQAHIRIRDTGASATPMAVLRRNPSHRCILHPATRRRKQICSGLEQPRNQSVRLGFHLELPPTYKRINHKLPLGRLRLPGRTCNSRIVLRVLSRVGARKAST